ncbi:MAG: helix-turn-helix transcriptional regulator [Alphaproteobacteria bacterium]|nr:helix-turn-helix transcriptional regulator [Alphaproteobacteria bacterium]
MNLTTTIRDPAAGSFGRLLKEGRQFRGLSQLDLALNCGVSQRHLSFLESGRARPSRGMALNLASALGLPLRQQNALLIAAGFAPVFSDRPLDAPGMEPVATALRRMLAQQEPYPAVLVDRAYNLQDANSAAGRLLAFLLDSPPGADGQPVNLVELLLAPDGLRRSLANWETAILWLVRRLRAELVMEGGHRGLSELVARAMARPEISALMAAAPVEADQAPALNLRFERKGQRLEIFSMIATMGTPLDATLQDIRIEFFFPADPETERWFASGAHDPER